MTCKKHGVFDQNEVVRCVSLKCGDSLGLILVRDKDVLDIENDVVRAMKDLLDDTGGSVGKAFLGLVDRLCFEYGYGRAEVEFLELDKNALIGSDDRLNVVRKKLFKSQAETSPAGGEGPAGESPADSGSGGGFMGETTEDGEV